MDLGSLLARIDPPEVARIAISLAIVVAVSIVALRLTQRFVGGVVARTLTRPAGEDTRGQLTVLEFEKRKRTLEALGGNLARIVILGVAAMAVLGIFSVDLGPAIAGLGLVGLGVALGAQSLVKDIVAGAFILAENQYGRGDIVTIAAVTGTVEDLGLRRTILRDFDGTVHVVPNGLIGVASNLTRVWARVVVDIPIKDPARVAEAITLIDTAGEAMANDPRWKRRLLAAPKVDRVKALSAAGVTLKVVGSVGAGDRWDAAGDIRGRVLAALSAAGIDLGG
ncbi:MAG: mechanosensitive ion channel family protein [Chloroflexi bacterium]|nr:mechanosensitive ion channel family protein [Chloroflexota bacterium]MBA3850777.1 mechanosensitive ion channel family protein [Chloroflexota bacterium]MDQ3407247.1 mechanosensitive ion channel family protein [Chloroflexota bacterium]